MDAESPYNESRLTVFERQNNYEPPFLVLIAAFLCSLYLLSPNTADPDLWGHVRYGQDALAENTIHTTTTYSYLAEGQTWINHESIAEWTMGWIGPRFGGAGLMLMKVFLAAYSLMLLHLIIRRRTLDSLASCILLVGGAWAMRYYWGTRPQLFSFASFATVLFLLDQGFSNWYRYRNSDTSVADNKVKSNSINWLPLVTLPLVIAFWTNSHGGFVVGLVVVILLLLGRASQATVQTQSVNWQLVARLVVVIATCCLATLCTPYGIQLLNWIAGSLGTARPEILEWGPWDLSAAGQRLIWFVSLLILAIAISQKPKDWVEIAIILLLTWQSLKHMRHSPFLVMALMAWGSPHLRNSCRRLQSIITDWYGTTISSAEANKKVEAVENDFQEATAKLQTDPLKGLPTHRWVRRSVGVNFGAGLLCCWFGFLLWNQCSVIRVDHERYPVAAFHYLKEKNIGGRTMITFNWAQYAIDALCPPLNAATNNTLLPAHLVSNENTERNQNPPPVRTSIALDGRFRTAYSQNLIDWHFDFLIGDQKQRSRHSSSGPINPDKMLKLGEPELVILERRNEVSCQTMRSSKSDWIMLYQDSIAEIWGQQSVFDNPKNARYIPVEDRISNLQSQPYWSPWPAK